MEWIDFNLDTPGDPDRVDRPLVRSWWEGQGFAGRCPHCQNWIRFTTLGMSAIGEDEAEHLPRLPDHWHTIAQFG
jgi:hypothetical protein